MLVEANNIKFYEYTITKDPKYLVVFLHGYGSCGKDLISNGVAPNRLPLRFFQQVNLFFPK